MQWLVKSAPGFLNSTYKGCRLEHMWCLQRRIDSFRREGYPNCTLENRFCSSTAKHDSGYSAVADFHADALLL
jgi:hypothetical protein